MQPTMMAKAEPLGLRARAKRLGQAAGLVELDVDGVVFADERGERGAVVHALVGADRDRPRDARERRVVVRRQRLLDQRDAGGRAGGEVLREIVRAPSLVGIDDQFGVRRGRTHGADARAIALRRRASPSGACARTPCRRPPPSRRAHRARSYRRSQARGEGTAPQGRTPPARSPSPRNPRTRSRARCAPRPPASRAATPHDRGHRQASRASPRSPPQRLRWSRRSAHRARTRRGR